MKFDIVIGNPPFNDMHTVQAEGVHRKQSRNLAKEFLLYGATHSKEFVCLVGPTSRTYTSGVKKKLLSYGLYEVEKVSKHFPNIAAGSIVTYTFDKLNKKALKDCTEFHIPEHNLGQLYTFTTGFSHPRKEVEALLKDSGKYKVYVTTGIIKYTDDEEVVEFINDKSRGRLRVVMNHNASFDNVGRLHIAYPEDILSYSTNAFYIDNVKQGEQIIEYLSSPEAKTILKATRASVTNSRKSFSNLPIPYEV